MKPGSFGISVLLALTLAGAALAYVLPGGAILRRASDARDEMSVSNYRVFGTVTFLGASAKEAWGALGIPNDKPEAQFDATWSVKIPRRCRIDVVSPDATHPVSAIYAQNKLRREGGEVAALTMATQEICSLLALRGASENDVRSQLDGHLTALEVDSKKSSLARFGGTIAYVLGASEDMQPQFWVYKDSFLPARVKFGNDTAGRWDVRFLDYSSPMTGDWFPRVLEVHRDGQLALRFTTLRADSRAKLDDRLFAAAEK